MVSLPRVLLLTLFVCNLSLASGRFSTVAGPQGMPLIKRRPQGWGSRQRGSSRFYGNANRGNQPADDDSDTDTLSWSGNNAKNNDRQDDPDDDHLVWSKNPPKGRPNNRAQAPKNEDPSGSSGNLNNQVSIDNGRIAQITTNKSSNGPKDSGDKTPTNPANNNNNNNNRLAQSQPQPQPQTSANDNANAQPATGNNRPVQAEAQPPAQGASKAQAAAKKPLNHPTESSSEYTTDGSSEYESDDSGVTDDSGLEIPAKKPPANTKGNRNTTTKNTTNNNTNAGAAVNYNRNTQLNVNNPKGQVTTTNNRMSQAPTNNNRTVPAATKPKVNSNTQAGNSTNLKTAIKLSKQELHATRFNKWGVEYPPNRQAQLLRQAQNKAEWRVTLDPETREELEEEDKMEAAREKKEVRDYYSQTKLKQANKALKEEVRMDLYNSTRPLTGPIVRRPARGLPATVNQPPANVPPKKSNVTTATAGEASPKNVKSQDSGNAGLSRGNPYHEGNIYLYADDFECTGTPIATCRNLLPAECCSAPGNTLVDEVGWRGQPGDEIFWWGGTRRDACAGSLDLDHRLDDEGWYCGKVGSGSGGASFGDPAGMRRKRDLVPPLPASCPVNSSKVQDQPSGATAPGCQGERRALPMVFAEDGQTGTWALQFQNFSQLEDYKSHPRPKNNVQRIALTKLFEAQLFPNWTIAMQSISIPGQ